MIDLKNRKYLSILLTLATLCATAAVNYAVLHGPFVVIGLLVLFAHEMGHYFAAKRHGVDFGYPFFIPIPLFSLGVTLTEKASPEAVRDISISGPIAGLSAIVVVGIVNSFIRVVPHYYLLLYFLFELFFNYFGSDGKKYRNAIINKNIVSSQNIGASSPKESIWKRMISSPNLNFKTV